MYSFEERKERAFAHFWARRPVWWIEGLEQMSMGRFGADDEGGLDPLGALEQAANETMARHLVREHVQRVWEAREAARVSHRKRWAAALRGEVTGDDPGEVRALAEHVQAGQVEEVRRSILKRWPLRGLLDFPWGGPSAAVRYRAAVLLRNAGEAEGAYHAFAGCRNEWYYLHYGGFPIHTPIVPRSGSWRYGVPSTWATWRAAGPPLYSSFDMSRYDWVIGFKPIIRYRTLTLLGVHRSHQVVLERSGELPRLRGRVAVVDDVFDGRDSSCVAQVYNADVIDIGRFLDDGDSWEYPVCTIWEERLLREVDGRLR